MQVLHMRTWRGQCSPGRWKALLFTLAAFVARLFGHESAGAQRTAKPTFLGIAILVAAAAVMPWLAKQKRRLSAATGSAALKADAAQSALMCLPVADSPWRDWRSTRDLARQVGRPRCGFSRFCRSSFGRVRKRCAGKPAAVASFVPRPPDLP